MSCRKPRAQFSRGQSRDHKRGVYPKDLQNTAGPRSRRRQTEGKSTEPELWPDVENTSPLPDLRVPIEGKACLLEKSKFQERSQREKGNPTKDKL